MLAAVNTWDFNPATNEHPLGTGYTGTSGIEAIIYNPLDGELYGVDYQTLGTFETTSGEFFSYPDPIGWVNGPLGWIEVIDVDGLTLNPDSGYLWASVRMESAQPDLIIKLDVATGAAVPGAFAGSDYLVVQTLPDGAHDIDDIALDPAKKILYAVINKRGREDRIATIDTFSGIPTDLGAVYCPHLGIYIQDIEGLGFGCNGMLWAVTGNKDIPEVNDRLWELTWNGSRGRIEASAGRTLSYGSDYEGVTCGYLPAPAPSPVPVLVAGGDYDGDGTADPAFFRPSTGYWKFRGLGSLYFGKNGDRPVPGDYDGGGADRPAYFRDSNAFWKVFSFSSFYFGQSGDLPVPADYDGDGATDPAYFRDSSAFWKILSVSSFWFGRPGDIPVPADYDGDGIDDIALDPVKKILYAVINKRGREDRIATIDTITGVPTDLGRMYCPVQGFYVQDMEGLGFGCDGLLWGVTGNKNVPEVNDRLWEIYWNDVEKRYEVVCGRELSYGSDYEGVTCGYLPAPAPSPVPVLVAGGDYDGDGTADPAFFRPSTGYLSLIHI